jgi:putative acetyltransferase
VIRPERAGDEDAIRLVETAAFGRELEARIVGDVRGSPAFIPDLSLVAEDDARSWVTSSSAEAVWSRVASRSSCSGPSGWYPSAKEKGSDVL